MCASPRFSNPLWLVLAALLLSCGSRIARPVPVPRLEELHKLALVIQEGADGRVVHTWRPASDFQEARQTLPSSVNGNVSAIPLVRASGRRRDCGQEQIDCHRNCMRRKLPAPHNYIPRGDPRHNQICRERCLALYLDCVDAEKARALEFSAADDATDWLKEHRTELLVGAVVVIAGVTFVVVSAGAGLVVLAPVVLMASADGVGTPRCVGDW